LDIDTVTETIIGGAYRVHNTLGSGYLEKVYENALLLEIQDTGLHVRQQDPIPVYYRGKSVGEYYADLLVEERLIIEVKAVRFLIREHEVQLVNYLTATGFDHGLLINFGSSVQVKRKFREYRPRAGDDYSTSVPDLEDPTDTEDD